MSKKNLILLLCLWLILPFQLQAQGFLKTQGKSIVGESGDTVLLRGMGLGGWMLQEGYMLKTESIVNAQHQIREKIEQVIGTANTEQFYENWLSSHIRKIDIDSLKAWGFNSVRLAMHYNLYTLPIEDEPVGGKNTWLNKGFELTDSLISWCKQNQMYVILDLHAAPGGQGLDQGISDYNPAKPSLWESQANQDKTVALWKKLAEKYADEPWVGGYDLLNETNWNMAGNALLSNLYKRITDSIRSVDTKHIIFIEGNWFANDFTGLTPPWDDNMVYAPHKYWSTNDQASIQWVLNIQNSFNVPLYLGEFGENSNTWMRDAIKLFEENGIGWAAWTMKKVDDIRGPLSVPRPAGYQELLDYWLGNGPSPGAAAATTTLFQLAENFKLENCIYQQDFIDAMFRQVSDDKAIPYNTQNIPGVVYSTDYDMGVVGSAYFDTDLATYHVTTGNFTAWNQGWSYRNDGVDIQITEDTVNTNGFNVGWISNGEWMQYDVDVASSAVYDILVRVAANDSNGKFHFSAGGADISPVISVSTSGGWQNWKTVTIPNIILDPAIKKLRYHMDKAGFNLGSFEFIQKGATNSIPADYLSAFTLDDHTVQLNLNKPLSDPIPNSPTDFQILINGSPVTITETTLNSDNTRIITFKVNHTFRSYELIKISYSGNQIQAQDGTNLNTFDLRDVQNTVAVIHPVPGKVEAEDFFFQTGIQLENTTDIGGGQNIGFLDAGDYLDYYINVSEAGTYRVDYRTAALSETGQIHMQLIDDNGDASFLHSVLFPPTGGWQTWTTTPQNMILPAGQHQLRMRISSSMFNINWFEFTLLTTGIEDPREHFEVKVFPNPAPGLFNLKGTLSGIQDIKIEVTNQLGQPIFHKILSGLDHIHEILDLQSYPKGLYVITIRMENGLVCTKSLVYQ